MSQQQRMQNYQQPQDSQSLKEEIQKGIQEKQELENKFKENMFNDPKFQDLDQKLKEQGFSLEDLNFNSVDSNNGRFNLNYKNNDKNESAQISGDLENQEISKIQSLDSKKEDKLYNKLKENSNYKKYKKQLEKQGYKKQNLEANIDLDQNKIILKENYINNNEQKVNIHSEFKDNTLKKVVLNKDEKNKNCIYNYLIVVLLIMLVFCIYRYIKRKNLKNKTIIINDNKVIIQSKFDYIKEVKKIIKDAEVLITENKLKGGYQKISYAIRLYLSYKYGFNKELTISKVKNIINTTNIKNKLSKKEIIFINNLLERCLVVEFAKSDCQKKEIKSLVKETKDLLNIN
jgi:hypothetical protein